MASLDWMERVESRRRVLCCCHFGRPMKTAVCDLVGINIKGEQQQLKALHLFLRSYAYAYVNIYQSIFVGRGGIFLD